MQIQRNINVSYSIRKETNNSEGMKSLKLEDPFAVLDDIKQTPRYWKKAKFEIFAKPILAHSNSSSIKAVQTSDDQKTSLQYLDQKDSS